MDKKDKVCQYETKLHKAKKGYVGEILIKKEENNFTNFNNIELIMIVDRSGSMYGNYPKIFKKVMPLFLDKINFPKNKEVHFITFDSVIEYRKINKSGFINAKEEEARGGTNMEGVFKELEKIIIDKNSSYRILILSDGYLSDSKAASNSASVFYNKIKGKYTINAQAVRFFSSEYSNPDIIGLASVIQFNTINKPTLIDVNGDDHEEKIAEQLSKLFIDDGLENRFLLLSDKENLRLFPWEEKANQILLSPGNNIFWLDFVSDLKIKVNDNNPIDEKIIYEEDLNINNYKIILSDKIEDFMKKIKIYKILENDIAEKQIEMIVNSFKEFEVNLETINEEETNLKDEKMNQSKSKGLISQKMEEIQNEQNLYNLNNQEKTDYLRGEYTTKPKTRFRFNSDNVIYEEEDYLPSIIIDNGTDFCKAGFSGEFEPSIVFPTCVGYPKYNTGYKKEFFVGADAKARRGVLKLCYPIEDGIVNNWDDMEKIWEYVFVDGLRVDPNKSHNVLLTEPPLNPKENREKMAEIMFEIFNVHGLYIAVQAVLSLYYAGKFTGMSIDSGEGVTQFVPIFDGYSLPHAISKLDIAGRDLTEYFVKLLLETGLRFTTTAEKEIVKAIKEKSCYVALDLEDEIRAVEPFIYELPDGTHVVIRDQRIRCPEALFKPSMAGKEGNGISQTCYDSIQKCDIDIRKNLYNCIILSGGTTMFNGLPERLTKDMKSLAPYSMKEEIKVIASPERKFAVWLGGSILSSISTFESKWITKTEYEENGATIVRRKCF